MKRYSIPAVVVVMTFAACSVASADTSVRASTPMAQLRTATAPSRTAVHVPRDVRVFREYPVRGNPLGITEGFDRSFLFTEVGNSAIGKIGFGGVFEAEYTTPTANSEPNSISRGPDGNYWFTEFEGQIGKMTPAGVFTEFVIPGNNVGPNQIVAGPDGNMWFTETANAIGTINVSTGVITNYDASAFGYIDPNGIVSAPDGNLYFTANANDSVYRITTAGVISLFCVASGSPADLQNIIVGGDGALWFAEGSADKIGRVTLKGALREYALPTSSNPHGIVAGFNKSIYFANVSNSTIGSIVNGQVAEYGASSGSQPVNIIQGPTNQLWFTEVATSKIGVFQQQAKK